MNIPLVPYAVTYYLLASNREFLFSLKVFVLSSGKLSAAQTRV